jgi:hypothetical protein
MFFTETPSEKDMKISSPPKKRPKIKLLNSSEKHMILDVCKTKLQLNPNVLIKDIVSKAAHCIGVSESSIYRVIREYKNTHILKSSPECETS